LACVVAIGLDYIDTKSRIVLEAFHEELYRILHGLILLVVEEVIRQCLPPTQIKS